ncbi:MAG: gliding motility-associated ABC transporter permease subunit GldF [Chitinophagaceae bacterium]|nr:MAG: gliding motility-associated ABC transporter permease subunit GldF [Chitinophagaceae bacterium]
MTSIFFKELNHFFSSLVGYIAITVFLVATGLFIWIFPDTNLLDYGYATLEGLFITAPYIFLFLVPAITMRTFAEEKSSGTIEMLVTKPINDVSIILGKYLATLVLIAFAIFPTLLYYLTIYLLGAPVGNIDTGAVHGSYIGLFLLAASFAAIGVFASSITSNQIVAFVLALFLCFFFFLAFEFLSRLPILFAGFDYLVEQLGINAHYRSISRGVIDTRDIVYFLSLIVFFLSCTKISLESRKW